MVCWKILGDGKFRFCAIWAERDYNNAPLLPLLACNQ